MIKFIASGFYSGYLPKAPGTWGSVVALPLCYLILPYGLQALYGATLGCFLIGWFCSHPLTRDPAADPDPSYIVIDEIAGVMLTLALSLSFLSWSPELLLNVSSSSVKVWSCAFVAFRIFDIWKPFPICIIDEYLATTSHWRGFGVMIDDILAAIPAAAMVWGCLTFIF
ncbi:phosphatidylglycerophosphatase A family protein [Candidatus Odyssella thessalonicensis]|uniref:phosphatidylglycerophosphatase A family protein n=1 Tax=Candidatus Odyssella thessalonicensis TaxID=84647 RepID=UPI000225A950|nr:phosphatidylglycerophosphatase A [Candidatus Odyssella thessalonicensis]